MFSDNERPFIQYRVVENMFCLAFGAENLARLDCAVDAKLGDMGVGIKTFITSGNSKIKFEKIAEFDELSSSFRNLSGLNLAIAVSKQRNLRLETTKTVYGLNSLCYHCLIRDVGKVMFIEPTMPFINVDDIKCIKERGNNLQFSDGRNEYIFSKSKSTLYMKFDFEDPILEMGVVILADPFAKLAEIFDPEDESGLPLPALKRSIILPLFSIRGGGGLRFIPDSSGLNQWRASGRKRKDDEVYIPYPVRIRNADPGFFPPRGEPFKLSLPDGTVLSASVCQDGGKAIMSNPNTALGLWLLRKVLKIEYGTKVTYEMLAKAGINYVQFFRDGDFEYSVDVGYDPGTDGYPED